MRVVVVRKDRRVGCGKVLVVEDEYLVRLILTEWLEDEGFAVVAVGSGEEAVCLLRKVDDWRAVVTDIHMPGSLDGVAVGRHVRSHREHLPVIYVTGQPGSLNALGQLNPTEALLRKPYLPSQVVAKLNELLSAA